MKLPTLLVPLEEQAIRFVRLFGVAIVPQLVAINGHVTRDVVVSLVVGAAETSWKELHAQVKSRQLAHNGPVTVTGDPTVGTDNKQ